MINYISDIYEEIGRKVYEKHIREENISIKIMILYDYFSIYFIKISIIMNFNSSKSKNFAQKSLCFF